MGVVCELSPENRSTVYITFLLEIFQIALMKWFRHTSARHGDYRGSDVQHPLLRRAVLVLVFWLRISFRRIFQNEEEMSKGTPFGR